LEEQTIIFMGKLWYLLTLRINFVVTSCVSTVPGCLQVTKLPQKYYFPLLYSTALYFCTQKKLGSVTTLHEISFCIILESNE